MLHTLDSVRMWSTKCELSEYENDIPMCVRRHLNRHGYLRIPWIVLRPMGDSHYHAGYYGMPSQYGCTGLFSFMGRLIIFNSSPMSPIRTSNLIDRSSVFAFGLDIPICPR